MHFAQVRQTNYKPPFASKRHNQADGAQPYNKGLAGGYQTQQSGDNNNSSVASGRLPSSSRGRIASLNGSKYQKISKQQTNIMPQTSKFIANPQQLNQQIYEAQQKIQMQMQQEMNVENMHEITNIRQQPPIGHVQKVKMAQYQINKRSSVTKANSGKIEKLGTFVQRAEILKNTSSQMTNYMTANTNFDSNPNMLVAESSYNGYQTAAADSGLKFHHKDKPHMQYRNRSQLQIKAQRERQILTGSKDLIQTGSVINSGLSSYNIKAARYNTNSNQQQQQSIGMIGYNSLQQQQQQHTQPQQLPKYNQQHTLVRKRSALKNSKQSASLKRLHITNSSINNQSIVIANSSNNLNDNSINLNGPAIDYGVILKTASDTHDTNNILEKNARRHKQKLLRSQSGKQRNKQKVTYLTTESNEEKVKLVVVQSSFTDVIQAMYTNEKIQTESNMEESQPSKKIPSVEQEERAINNQINYSQDPTVVNNDEENASQVNFINSTLLNDTNARAQSTVGNEDIIQDVMGENKFSSTTENVLTELHTRPLPNEQELKEEEAKKQKTQTLQSTQQDVPESTNPADHKRESINTDDFNAREIKMMDTIIFRDGFQPVHWIFTDLLGKIQSKEISQITVNEVIKAFLINLNHNKKADFNNDDLMQFLDKDQIGQKICFAIKGSKRELLDINDLLELRKKYPRGIDALQLFKIPTRQFIPFYFHHILSFDQMGRPLRSTLIRLPIKEVQQQMDRITLNEMMNVIKERTSTIQQRIQHVSNDVVSRLTEVSPVVLLNVVIVYLLEDDSLDPWFIGTEKCEVLTQKSINRKKTNRRQLNNQKQSDQNISSPIYEGKFEHTSGYDENSTHNSNQSPDNPNKIQVIDTQINSFQNQTPSRVNRGGRTSSTTTVFQKLDSRSQITTQKNPQNEDGVRDDTYMTMLHGSDDHVQDLLKNPELGKKGQKGEQISAPRLINKVEGDDGQFSGVIISSTSNGNKMRYDRSERPQSTTLINQRTGINIKPDSEKAAGGPLSNFNAVTGTQLDEQINSNQSSFFLLKPQPESQRSIDENKGETESNVVLDDNYSQTQRISEAEPEIYNKMQYDDKNFIYNDTTEEQNINMINTSAFIEPNHENQQQKLIQDKEQIEDILQNNTFVENLRDGALFQEQEATDYKLGTFGKFRGHSANVYGARSQPSNLNNPSQGSRSYLQHHMSAIGTRTGDQQQVAVEQDVYLLESNEFLTANELFQGLAKIGVEYGRSASNQNVARYQHNLHTKNAINQKKGTRGVSTSRLTQKTGGASRIKAFLERQEQLRVTSSENKAQKMNVKPQGRRLLELFPQYLEKSASRHHSKFLFGDSDQATVFRDYKNAMLQVENQVKNLGDCMLPQEVIKDDVKMLQLARENAAGGKVFDLKMSDNDEMIFLENVVGGQVDPSNLRTESDVQQAQNLDLESLDKEKPESEINATNEALVNDTEDQTSNDAAKQYKARPQKKKRNFLAEALYESRMIFKQHTKQRSLLNLMDKQALTMIEAHKKLDGVAVIDPDKIINDFKNNHLYRPAPDANDYNLVGEVPKVNPDLAQKYVEMKEIMRRRKLFEDTQRQVQQKQQAQATATFYKSSNPNNRKSAKPRSSHATNQRTQPKLLSRAKSQQRRQFLHVSGHELDMPSQLPSSREQHQNHHQHQPMNVIIQDQAMNLNTNAWGNAASTNTFNEKSTSAAKKNIPIGVGVEMVVEPTILNAGPQSFETIDQVQSIHRKSDTTINQLNGVKCSLGLCCDNPNILLSQEMSMQDICYIQQGELNRAKQFLLKNKTEDTIFQYSQQFNKISSSYNQIQQQSSPDHQLRHNSNGNLDREIYSQPDRQQFNNNRKNASMSMQQLPVELLEPSRKEIGLSVQDNNQFAKKSTISVDSQIITEAAEQIATYDDNAGKVAQETIKSNAMVESSLKPKNQYGLGSRNQQPETRYGAMTQQIILESFRSMQKKRMSISSGEQTDQGPPSTLLAKRELVEMVSISGLEAVKKLTEMVLNDYSGGNGMFGEEYDQANQHVAADRSSTNSITNTNIQASIILKPIEEMAEQKRQIFKHEGLTPDHANQQTMPLPSSLDLQQNSAAEQSIDHKNNELQDNEIYGSGVDSQLHKIESQLSQLGIRHVKLDEENWVPSPELVPCCVRCFSIATYVLNYHIGNNQQQFVIAPSSQQQTRNE